MTASEVEVEAAARAAGLKILEWGISMARERDAIYEEAASVAINLDLDNDGIDALAEQIEATIRAALTAAAGAKQEALVARLVELDEGPGAPYDPAFPGARQWIPDEPAQPVVDLDEQAARENVWLPAQPVVETEAGPTCRTFDAAGDSICDRPARFIVWGHLYEKPYKGPKCGRHLPPGVLLPSGFGAPAIYAIPARRSQPAPRTVTAEEDRAAYAVAHRYIANAYVTERLLREVYAALGIEVTP